MAKNPVIQKAKQEAYNQGFAKGQEYGLRIAEEFFASKFEGLDKVKGVGPRTLELFVNHFGAGYFKKVKI
jgi:hypothetical protein